jgi:hypothetical protein
MLRLRRLAMLVAVFLLLSCPFAFADFDDEATVGGQDSSGNYRWRVTSDGDLIPGTTAVNDLGTTAKAIAEVHATTLYVTDGFSAQGKTASYSYPAGNVTVSLTYGLMAKTIGTGSETITVPDGTYAGQTIWIEAIVDGGGQTVIDPTTSSGFTRVYLDAVLDQVTLRWISASYGWIIVGQYGVTID